jgi:hypothetical protein
MGWTGVLACAASVCAAVPALAHHSIAAIYDREKTVEVRGVLSKVELQNPHSMFEVTQPGRNGAAPTVWMLESRGLQGMTRVGFDRGAIAVGDRVTVKGQPARSGDNSLWLVTLETAEGKRFDFNFNNRTVAP